MISRLAGEAAARFRATEWPAEAAVHRSASGLGALAALDDVADPAVWLDVAPQLASFRADGPLPRSVARKRYDEGDSIYITGLEQTVPALRALCDELARDVAVDASCVTIEAWGAGGPTRVAMHFDLDFNFNVQVRGKKRWKTAPNRHVKNPVASHHVHEARGAARSLELPTIMPDDSASFEVAPGDVVYLPHGVWHATETDEPTFAAAFVIKTPSWADHVTRALSSRLSLDPRWRARVLGGRDFGLAGGLRTTADEVLGAAASELARVVASDLLFSASWNRAADLFAIAPLVRDVRLDGDRGELCWSAAGEARTFRVPSWAQSVTEAMLSCPQPWSFAALADTVPGPDSLFFGVLVTRLEAAGLLVRRTSSSDAARESPRSEQPT